MLLADISPKVVVPEGSVPFLHDASTQRTQRQQGTEIGPVVQGISANAIAGAIVEALHKASNGLVAASKTIADEQIPVK